MAAWNIQMSVFLIFMDISEIRAVIKVLIFCFRIRIV